MAVRILTDDRIHSLESALAAVLADPDLSVPRELRDQLRELMARMDRADLPPHMGGAR